MFKFHPDYRPRPPYLMTWREHFLNYFLINLDYKKIKSKHVPESEIVYKVSCTLMYPFENESETKETCHSEFLAINLNYFMNNYSKTHPKC